MTSASLHSTVARPSACFHLRKRCMPTTCHVLPGMLPTSGCYKIGLKTKVRHFEDLKSCRPKKNKTPSFPGMEVWQCCCRHHQSRETSLSCCRKSSGSRRLNSWNRSPQQLDSALRSTRYTVFWSLEVSIAILFMYKHNYVLRCSLCHTLNENDHCIFCVCGV